MSVGSQLCVWTRKKLASKSLAAGSWSCPARLEEKHLWPREARSCSCRGFYSRGALPWLGLSAVPGSPPNGKHHHVMELRRSGVGQTTCWIMRHGFVDVGFFCSQDDWDSSKFRNLKVGGDLKKKMIAFSSMDYYFWKDIESFLKYFILNYVCVCQWGGGMYTWGPMPCGWSSGRWWFALESGGCS